MDDAFDAFHAARAWYAYSLTVVPPPKTDETGEPMPWMPRGRVSTTRSGTACRGRRP